jgi:hypothetical protein
MCLLLICSLNKTLQKLSLNNHLISDVGAASIGGALACVQAHATPQIFFICFMHVKTCWARLLSFFRLDISTLLTCVYVMCSQHNSLQLLSLCNNHIGDDGAAAIGRALTNQAGSGMATKPTSSWAALAKPKPNPSPAGAPSSSLSQVGVPLPVAAPPPNMQDLPPERRGQSPDCRVPRPECRGPPPSSQAAATGGGGAGVTTYVIPRSSGSIVCSAITPHEIVC